MRKKETADYSQIMKKKFTQWVKFYDFFEIILLPLRKVVADSIGKDGNILDLCCGTGAIAIRIAKSRPLSNVFGLDLSTEMLEEAKKKSIALGNIKFLEGIAQKIPFPNSYFDFVTICFALHEMPKEMRNEVLKDIFRVLKDQGKIIILDVRKVDNWFKYFLFVYLKCFEPPYVFEFVEQDLKGFIKENGFSSVKEEHISALRLVIGEK